MDLKEMEELRKIARINFKKRLENEASRAYQSIRLDIENAAESKREINYYLDIDEDENGKRLMDAVINLLTLSGFSARKRLIEYTCSAHGWDRDDVGPCMCRNYWEIKVWGWL